MITPNIKHYKAKSQLRIIWVFSFFDEKQVKNEGLLKLTTDLNASGNRKRGRAPIDQPFSRESSASLILIGDRAIYHTWQARIRTASKW